VLAGKLSEQEWRWWSSFLNGLDERVGKARQAAGVLRIVSTIKNNHGDMSIVPFHFYS
jgi:hypothetical protein